MSLERLSIRGFRNLVAVDLDPGPGVNWLVGDNGAGKTSVLEAIYLLARGRSFRSSQMGAVIGHKADQLMVVGHLSAHGASPELVMGIERDEGGWRGRLGGQDCHRISEFAQRLPVVLLEPDSHRLISDGPQARRQYLDWLLFHVEPNYLPIWQRYQKTLKQRNAALKAGAPTSVISALDAPLVAAGEVLNELRAQQVARLLKATRELNSTLGLRLPGEIDMTYRAGHASELSLSEALAQGRDRDRESGFTRAGPHRGDLVLRCGGYPAANESSRGQQKLLATLLLLAKWDFLAEQADFPPILLLDDPVSELDQEHLKTVMAWLENQGRQVWVTATEKGPKSAKMFHVERGEIHSVV